MDVKELLLASFASNKNTSAFLVNYLTSGTITSYKNGGGVEKHFMLPLGNDYLLTGNKKEPKLHLWQVSNPEPLKKIRLILPGVANCLAVCPNNIYLSVGIKTDLYVWQLSSGNLLTVQKKHYQNISVIKYSSCSNFLLTASEDGTINNYRLSDLLSVEKNGNVEPIYSKNYHNLKVTDISVGVFANARFATSSDDQTVKICDLLTGQLLLNLVFSSKVSCVVLDPPCWNLYAGCSNGSIHRFDLTEPPRTVDRHVVDEASFPVSSPVSSLSLNASGTVLASGGSNGHIYTFCTKTRQVLKKIAQEGAVTNVSFVFSHENYFSKQNFDPVVTVQTLRLGDDSDDVVVKQKCDVEIAKRPIRDECRLEELEDENRFVRSQNNALFEFARISKDG